MAGRQTGFLSIFLMSVLLLLKIPLLICLSFGMHITLTSPQSTPVHQELIGKSGWEVTLPTLLKPVFWVVSFAEAAVILASFDISHPISQFINKALVHGSTDPRAALQINSTFVFGLCMSLTGALIRYTCYRELGKFFTFELSIRKDHRLITSGPYSIVRHPSYTGAMLAGVGCTICHVNQGSWAVCSSGLIPDRWIVFLILWSFAAVIGVLTVGPRLAKEDSMMKNEFGKKWDIWAASVRFKLVPGVY